MTRTQKWLLGAGLFLIAGALAIVMTARALAQRVEPYLKEQVVQYLRQRFESDVQLDTLQVTMPSISSLSLLLHRRRGAMARVEGTGLSLRHHGRTDLPPMFALKSFRFELDLGLLYDNPKIVPLVTVDGMEIYIPPKGERPKLSKPGKPEPAEDGASEDRDKHGTKVIFEEVVFQTATLVILPKDQSKVPLRFDIQRLRLASAGADTRMRYEASLTNPKPIGQIQSTGTFGPWQSGEPADTPLSGDYSFSNADLGIFSGIAGILQSTGRFDGTLSKIAAHGQASVPDFRLKSAGNPVPLSTTFEVLVDGTNGNTTLRPVVAQLGSTRFTTSGAVIKHEGERRRSINLDVSMPQGNLADLLRLAMKGSPFMAGRIDLKTRIAIPPLTGKVREKLLLEGRFNITGAKMLKSTVQDQIDQLSRRGQGQPNNQRIDEVVSVMAGSFRMENEAVTFKALSFAVAGAAIDLNGILDLDQSMLDFHGTLQLDAKVSETMTGWKRWALKPVDPFFAKNGAGTFLRIKIQGSPQKPQFGLDRGSDRISANRP